MTQEATLAWVAGEFTKGLAEAVSGMAGNIPTVTFEPAAEVGGASDWLWWRQPYSGLTEAVAWVGAAPAAWLKVGTAALVGAGLDGATEEDCRGTFLELLQQALAGLGGAFTAKAGREVLPDGGGQAQAPQAGTTARLALRFEGDTEPCSFVLVLGKGLAESLEAPTATPEPAAQRPADPTPNDSADRYELLLDVEMPVSVSFGRAHLPLREVVKLTSGAIVELNRAVSEPVELIVNNCVIARGEVVVVDGNYGVRIKQIISRRERLRTLH